MNKVLLVVSDATSRGRLVSALEVLPGLSCHGVAGNLREASGLGPADLLVVDLAVSDATDGLAWGALRHCHPTAPLAVLFGERDQLAWPYAVAARALGFFDKGTDEAGLVAGLQDVLQGEQRPPDGDCFERLGVLRNPHEFRAEALAQPHDMLDRLTCRDVEVLRLLADGASNREIAAQLGLSEKTVANRVSGILNKLDVRNRTQAAIWAKNQQLGGK